MKPTRFSSAPAIKAPHPLTVLRQIQRQIGGDLRSSARGVPFIVLEDDNRAVSLCYFRKSRALRVFEGFEDYAAPQTRHTFLDWPAARAFLQAYFNANPAQPA